jgi:hypothetical protein
MTTLFSCLLIILSVKTAGGIWLTFTIVHVKVYARKPDLHWPALVWLLASGIADAMITLSLVINLVCTTHNYIMMSRRLISCTRLVEGQAFL